MLSQVTEAFLNVHVVHVGEVLPLTTDVELPDEGWPVAMVVARTHVAPAAGAVPGVVLTQVCVVAGWGWLLSFTPCATNHTCNAVFKVNSLGCSLQDEQLRHLSLR